LRRAHMTGKVQFRPSVDGEPLFVHVCRNPYDLEARRGSILTKANMLADWAGTLRVGRPETTGQTFVDDNPRWRVGNVVLGHIFAALTQRDAERTEEVGAPGEKSGASSYTLLYMTV
jgi:hypothetical protein